MRAKHAFISIVFTEFCSCAHKSHKSQLMTKARRSLKSAALEQAGKKNATLNYINAKKSHVYKFSTY